MELRGVTGGPTDGISTPEQQQARDLKQEEIANNVLRYWKENGSSEPYPAVVMPTGFGKSRITGHVLNGIHRQYENARILTLVGTKNILLEQNMEALGALVAEDIGDNTFTVLPDTSGRVTLCTWQGLATFLRKPSQVPEFDLVVVDEVHNTGTPARIKALQRLSAPHVVGLTATAWRSSGSFRAPEEYGFTVVDSMGLPECINNGWNSPLMGLAIDTEVILPADVREGESLNGRKLYRTLRNHPQLFQTIARDIAIRFLPQGMKTVIAVNRVREEACVIARELMRLGFKVGLAVNKHDARALEGEFVTHDTLKRSKLPRDHPDWIQVVISPQVIGEGYDDPTIECIIWAAPTLSSLRYTQVMGRGSRLCPYKAYCLVVDYVYMIENYGYSTNFSQFFRKDELEELEGGYVYLGPPHDSQLTLPASFTAGGRVVQLLDLRAKHMAEAGDWLNLTQLTNVTGMSTTWVLARIEDRGVRGETRLDSLGRPQFHYPPYVGDELKRVAEAVPKAGGWFSIPALVTLTERSTLWVKARLEEVRAVGEDRRGADGNVYPHYEKEVADRLVALAKAVPEAGDWKTLTQMCRELRRDPEFIEQKLAEWRIEPEDRRGKDGNIWPHYPPSVFSRLDTEFGGVKDAGDWIVLPELVKQVGKSRDWVESELKMRQVVPEERRTLKGRIYLHYPPEYVSVLRAKAESTLPAGDWLTTKQVAREVRKSPQWTESQLQELKGELRDQPEERWASNNQIRLHWPPYVVGELRRRL